MRKQAVTLDSIQTNIQLIMQTLVGMQENIDYLVANAVIRDELRPIIREEIEARLIPVESRLMAAMDQILGKHKNIEEEQLAHTYRIDRLEKHVGLSAT